MADVKQGEIYWVDIPASHIEGAEIYKRRPYIIVSRTLINRACKTVVGVPMTTTEGNDPPHRIQIPAREIIRDIAFNGEIKDSVAKTDQIRVLDKSRLERRMGTLSMTAIVAVGLGLEYLFDIR